MGRIMTQSWGNPGAIWAQLEGVWRIERSISSGERFRGEAQFTRDGDNLFYREDGDFCLTNGQCFQAFRVYIYVSKPTGFAVYFDETPRRLFQNVTIESGSMTGAATHFCGQDTYQSVYSFNEKDRFTIEHNVQGSRKNYRMTSVYSRD